jgi:hypothetical protein
MKRSEQIDGAIAEVAHVALKQEVSEFEKKSRG